MNLYEFSQQNNDEMGVLITADHDPELYAKVTQEADRIILLSTPWKIPFDTLGEPLPGPLPPTTIKTVPGTRTRKAESGHCIRCAGSIALDPLKPYCPTDYASWAEYENLDYKDKYCHSCGKKHAATMRRPLCRDCFV